MNQEINLKRKKVAWPPGAVGRALPRASGARRGVGPPGEVRGAARKRGHVIFHTGDHHRVFKSSLLEGQALGVGFTTPQGRGVSARPVLRGAGLGGAESGGLRGATGPSEVRLR